MDPQSTPLVCPSHITQYIGAVTVGLIIGAGITFVFLKEAPQSTPLSLESARQEGFDTAVRFFNESSLGGMSSTPDSVYTLFGVVTGIQGNRITIHTVSENPFEDQRLSDRTAIVNSDTKIFNTLLKKQSVLQSEMEAFVKATQADSSETQALPPEPFTRTPSDIAGIKVGSHISATAKQDIKSRSVFSVIEIQIQQDRPNTD